jgi:predicted RNA-binding protein associated with RNAse of E/G family
MWSEGETIVRREVVHGRAWSEFPVIVVRDEPALLATYLAAETRFSFPPHPLVHPWRGTHETWQGNGMIMLQRPGDAYAVFILWHGPEREFGSWYLNLQEPFRRTATGYDTQDLELDLILHPDGRIEWKDDELLDQRVEEGRFTQDQACEIRAEARRLEAELATRGHWWDAWWALWEPDPAWDRAADVRAAGLA